MTAFKLSRRPPGADASAVYINNDDVRADLFDIAVRDDNIRIRTEEVKQLVAGRHDDFTDLSAALVKF